MIRQTIHHGSHSDFLWLTDTGDSHSSTLLQQHPEIFFGKYLAITSNDSGVAKLTPAHLVSGWKIDRGIGYSPLVKNVDEIPHQVDGPDSPGFDEFYVFDEFTLLGDLTNQPFSSEAQSKIIVFVNMLGVYLHNDPSDTEYMNALFWSQLDRINPTSYIADGQDALTFVTRDPYLFAKVLEGLSSAAKLD